MPKPGNAGPFCDELWADPRWASAPAGSTRSGRLRSAVSGFAGSRSTTIRPLSVTWGRSLSVRPEISAAATVTANRPLYGAVTPRNVERLKCTPGTRPISADELPDPGPPGGSGRLGTTKERVTVARSPTELGASIT